MFFGRKQEIETLQRLRTEKISAIAAIYGRRRVGKTALIKEAYKNEHILFFEGIEGQSQKQQLQNFLFQLKQQVENREINYDIKEWKEALIQLRPILAKAHQAKQNYVIVFDEFQWMANYKDDLVVELKMIWDQYLSSYIGTTLILCGSIASFMINKVIKSKALYGRIQKEMNLLPFKINEAKFLLEGHGHFEMMESLLLLGGIPLYLNMIKNYPSLYVAINELGFKQNGYLVTEFQKIFISHFGKNEKFEKIIRALAKNEYGLFREDISTICHIELSGNLSKDLFDLESAGFIKSFIPFDKENNSKIKKFILTDPYINFYLRFIEPNLKKIASETQDIFLKINQTPKFYSFLGRSFEIFCQNHASNISSILGFSGVDYNVGPYFRKALNEKGIQIDLLFDRQDNVMSLCEMKYSSRPIGIDVIKEVERKVIELEKITSKKKTIQKILIVKDEVTKDLLKSGYFYKIIRSEDFFIN